MRPSGQFLDARDPATSIVGMLLATASELCHATSANFRGTDMMWSRARAAQNTPAEVRHSVLSPQPGVFGFGLLKNREVRVGVLPQFGEVLERLFGFRRVTSERGGARDPQIGER